MSYNTNPAFIAGYLESALSSGPARLQDAVTEIITGIYTDLGMDEELAEFQAQLDASAPDGRQPSPSARRQAAQPSPSARRVSLQLSYTQEQMLKDIASAPAGRYNKRTLNALMKRGMVREVWSHLPGNDYPGRRYTVTQAGYKYLHMKGWVEPRAYDRVRFENEYSYE